VLAYVYSDINGVPDADSKYAADQTAEFLDALPFSTTEYDSAAKKPLKKNEFPTRNDGGSKRRRRSRKSRKTMRRRKTRRL